MTLRFIGLFIALLLATMHSAFAIRPDECEQQRALYPERWNDVSREKPLFICTSHYSGSLWVMVGRTDRAGRTLMSLVRLKGSDADAVPDPSKDVYRIWLDREQLRRWAHTRWTVDVVPGRGASFSLEAPLNMRFIIRSSLCTR